MNNKILVTYTSKYGSTRKYAEWIASALNADIYAAHSLDSKSLSKYDMVIYGGGLYAGGIGGVKLVTNNPCKNLIVYTVGLANPKTTNYSEILNKNFTPDQLEKTKFFHLRGGIDYKRLGPIHKIMMAMMKNMTKRKPESEIDTEDKEFLSTYNSKVDFEEEKTIEPIIAYIKGLKIV